MTFDELFEAPEFATRIEDALSQAREGDARLEVYFRSRPEGGGFKEEGRFRADNTADSTQILSKCRELAEASPGATFRGQLRFDFRDAGNTGTLYCSFTRKIAPEVPPSAEATSEAAYYANLAADNRRLQSANSLLVEKVSMVIDKVGVAMEAQSKFVAAFTPTTPEAEGLLGKMMAPVMGPLVTHLLTGGKTQGQAAPSYTPEQLAAYQAQQLQAQAWAYYQQTGQWPAGVPFPAQAPAVSPPGAPAEPPTEAQPTPPAPPAQLPPGPPVPPPAGVAGLTREQVMAWARANKAEAFGVAKALGEEMTSDEMAALMK